MDILEINKALSNKTRLEILQWLKEPEKHFEPHQDLGHFNDGVCVQHIRKKMGLSQSTISHYLSLMQNVDLVIPTRHGKWTYYKRNENTINRYVSKITMEL
ncbi:ArsR family transcriptional regulator [Maribacter spongiicola]|uniref:ArsR family transcriptional regulator n=1 Tax=Maribacter spongiicola TaxID=1206753 RepID=A0A4R7JQX0_9FLAO|nr:metalloregulator ArsR/SmtB family transcription factor [Maribacter spongiicola]TDT40560.1 ArsR family transcriptional regulator [Maribacter spongiicola]